ncbi:ubiquitin-conjugating enzyme E2 S [Belonocnema kinseyi]|uniref:ubiquitin-conjugating enzyme E2 S n=1 Tax=Belonocnema kinseyi TaxID=2817044 RepID=UPI00143E064D|nr:ubiquitin-conjugating enzyme E2 S [Belonocnema kinseyi]
MLVQYGEVTWVTYICSHLVPLLTFVNDKLLIFLSYLSVAEFTHTEIGTFSRKYLRKMAAASSISNVENLSPQIIRRVAKEMNELANDPPEGIRVIINDQDITDIQAVIEGPAETPYAGGSFKVKLALGKDFPQGPPKAFFLTKIFHPNVAKNGEICVNTLKKEWKSDLGIKYILLTVKCLLIVPNAESALNEEAGKLLLERYDDYSERAKMMTEIHAQCSRKGSSKSGHENGPSLSENGGPLPKKHAGDKKLSAEKKKMLRDKKRTLKRL